MCVLGFLGSSALLASLVEDSVFLDAKSFGFPFFFFFFFIFRANSATHLSAKTVSKSVNRAAVFCDVESCPLRLGPRLHGPFRISHQPAHTWQKAQNRISHACMTPGFGPSSSNPARPRYKSCSSFTSLCHDNTITWLPPCHALIGRLSETCKWKNELCTLARKESSSSQSQPLLPFLSSHVCCTGNSRLREITMNIYLHQERIHIPPFQGISKKDLSR